jgi:hypothetical protein
LLIGENLPIPIPMSKQLDYHKIREIFKRFQVADPEPKGELNHVNVYTLTVAVALSALASTKPLAIYSKLQIHPKKC